MSRCVMCMVCVYVYVTPCVCVYVCRTSTQTDSDTRVCMTERVRQTHTYADGHDSPPEPCTRHRYINFHFKLYYDFYYSL